MLGVGNSWPQTWHWSAAAKHIVWQALHCFTGALPSPTPADLSLGFTLSIKPKRCTFEPKSRRGHQSCLRQS